MSKYKYKGITQWWSPVRKLTMAYSRSSGLAAGEVPLHAGNQYLGLGSHRPLCPWEALEMEAFTKEMRTQSYALSIIIIGIYRMYAFRYA